MEFLVDSQGAMLYAVGSCGYTGGFSALSLSTNAARLQITSDGPRFLDIPPPPQIRPVKSTKICGERLTRTAHGEVIVAKTQRPVATIGAPGSLLVIDQHDGHLAGSIVTPVEPIDVLAWSS